MFCALETKNDFAICDICYDLLPWSKHRCSHCGALLSLECEVWSCEICQKDQPIIDKFITLFDYDQTIARFIGKLKYKKKFYVGRSLGLLLRDCILEQAYVQDDLPELLIPVPLHKKRLIKRGFNQVVEILRPFSEKKLFPLAFNAIHRIKNTPAQTTLSSLKRKRNLKNAFALVGTIEAKHVVVVDDVVTTGATVLALASLLKAKGVARVDVWCIARA